MLWTKLVLKSLKLLTVPGQELPWAFHTSKKTGWGGCWYWLGYQMLPRRYTFSGIIQPLLYRTFIQCIVLPPPNFTTKRSFWVFHPIPGKLKFPTIWLQLLNIFWTSEGDFCFVLFCFVFHLCLKKSVFMLTRLIFYAIAILYFWDMFPDNWCACFLRSILYRTSQQLYCSFCVLTSWVS